jgi:hypothetical protein
MTHKLSEDPLLQAERGLARIAKVSRVSMIIPLPVLVLATAGFFHLEAAWYENPFLALIFGIFALGQVMVVKQMRGLVVGARNTSKSLAVLAQAGDEPDLDKLRASLLENAPPGHLRDLLLRWIELGLRGETHGSEALLENAWDRRAIQDHSSVSFHVSLNRTTLKIGFLGTLYGLLITFPPMKNAVLGLADSDGEMKFIRDITAAIAGDELAILVTLGATALSVLIEMVTVQVLERTLNGFDLVNSHINDWNLTRLQPFIRKRYAAAKDRALDLDAELGKKLAEAQGVMDRNLGLTLETMAKTSKQIEMLAQVQVMVGRRVQELVDYEKQYRGFLASKQQGAAPAHLNPGPVPVAGANGHPAQGPASLGNGSLNGANGSHGAHGDAA